MPVVFPPGMAVTRVPPYVRRLFPSKENRQISERDISARPSYQGLGGQEIGLGSRNLHHRAEARPTGRAVFISGVCLPHFCPRSNVIRRHGEVLRGGEGWGDANSNVQIL